MAIIDQLARNKSLQQSAKRICGGNDLWQDLFHDSLLRLYDLGDTRVIALHKEGNIAGYMAVTMHQNWNNPRSAFNKQYRPKHETEYTDTPQTDELGDPMTIQKGDEELCYEYFGKDCNISPDRVVVARAMDKMRQEDNGGDKFHYRTALLKLYIQLGGISQIWRETKISRQYIRKDLNDAINAIKKNGEDTTDK